MPYRSLTGFSRLIAVVGTLSAAVLGQPRETRAQTGTDRSFEVNLFRAPVGPDGFITIDTARVPGHLGFGLSLTTNYQRSPLNVETSQADGSSLSFDVVRDQVVTELAGAIGILERFELGLALPFSPVLKGDQFGSMGEPAGELSSSGLGDLRVDGKVLLATVGEEDAFSFALSPGLTLPTGDDEKFLGAGSVTGRLRGLAEWRSDSVRVGAMLGVLLRDTARIYRAEVGSQLLYGVGVDYRPHRQMSLLAEVFGHSGLKDFSQGYVDANPVEADAGMRIRLPHRVNVAFGGGAGLVRGIGAPAFRGFLALGWAPDFRDRDNDGVPDAEDRCPDDPEDRDGYKDTDGCAEPDNDGDGLDDPQDKCANEPEDRDQHQDEDGCPETDNDKDGIPDLNDPCPNAAEDGGGKRPKDGCPTSAEDADGDGVNDANDQCDDEPEDRDGFQDYDGCPELDNDEDGIPDNFDACAGEAEDMDGFEDTDGCPDPDNDKDGVSDAQDKCPTQPESLNGNRDEDGCPDPGAEIVRLEGDRITTRERISFGPRGRLSAAGQAVAGLVGMVLRGHADLTVVRIDVTAAGVPAEEAQARADALKKAIVAKGVEERRLKAVGHVGAANAVEFVVETRAEPKTPPTPAQ